MITTYTKKSVLILILSSVRKAKSQRRIDIGMCALGYRVRTLICVGGIFYSIWGFQQLNTLLYLYTHWSISTTPMRLKDRGVLEVANSTHHHDIVSYSMRASLCQSLCPAFIINNREWWGQWIRYNPNPKMNLAGKLSPFNSVEDIRRFVEVERYRKYRLLMEVVDLPCWWIRKGRALIQSFID